MARHLRARCTPWTGVTLRLARSLTKPWQQALPLLPRKEPVGVAGGAKGTEHGPACARAADNTSGVAGGTWHGGFLYSLTGKINSNWALPKHPLAAWNREEGP